MQRKATGEGRQRSEGIEGVWPRQSADDEEEGYDR